MNIKLISLLTILGATAAAQAQVIVPAGQPVTVLTNPADYRYVANGFQETDGKIRAWNEQSSYTLSSALAVDVNAIGTYNKSSDLGNFSVAAGTKISSEYLYFDPKTSGKVDATIDFGTKILGIIVTSGTSASSDKLLASDFLIPSGVLGSSIPSTHFSDRGLELGSDSISMLSSTSISVSLDASSPGDQIRVITAAQAVPEPASLAVLGLGSIGLLLRKRA